MDMENKLRELLLPVLGLGSIDEIKPQDALVKDLGVDSIDFVEIIYLIEQNFGVVLKTNEIISLGVEPESLFSEGKLTTQGVDLIHDKLKGSGERYKEGMSKMDLFSNLTVADLAFIIQAKQAPAGGN